MSNVLKTPEARLEEIHFATPSAGRSHGLSNGSRLVGVQALT